MKIDIGQNDNNMDKNQLYSHLLDKQISTYKKEIRYLEFKMNHQDPQRLGDYISALSNGACLEKQDFGVEDEARGRLSFWFLVNN